MEQTIILKISSCHNIMILLYKQKSNCQVNCKKVGYSSRLWEKFLTIKAQKFAQLPVSGAYLNEDNDTPA
jgi:hypothetical protein